MKEKKKRERDKREHGSQGVPAPQTLYMKVWAEKVHV